MAHHVEPMDIDSSVCEFDNKENSLHHNNVLPRTPCTEKGYEELDVTELTMRLRYSITPTSSPMSKSFTANNTDNRNIESGDNANSNLTQSLNSNIVKTLPFPSSPKDIYNDSNRNPLRPLESVTDKPDNVTVTVSNPSENYETFSSSSSMAHTPEAITPTKDMKAETDVGSPIMRGLKNVLNMFRPSQSPIPSSEGEINTFRPEEVSPPVIHSPETADSRPQAILASTPLAAHKTKDALARRHTTNRDSMVFNEDLEKELQWKDDSTVIFSKDEKIPIHKLLLSHTKVLDTKGNSSNILNATNYLKGGTKLDTVEYMDISCNDSMVMEKTIQSNLSMQTDTYVATESDGEFVDCESTFTKDDVSKTEGKCIKTFDELEVGQHVHSAAQNVNISGNSLNLTKLVKSEISNETITTNTDDVGFVEAEGQQSMVHNEEEQSGNGVGSFLGHDNIKPLDHIVNDEPTAMTCFDNKSVSEEEPAPNPVFNIDIDTANNLNKCSNDFVDKLKSVPSPDLGVSTLSMIPLIMDPRVLLFNLEPNELDQEVNTDTLPADDDTDKPDIVQESCPLPDAVNTSSVVDQPDNNNLNTCELIDSQSMDIKNIQALSETVQLENIINEAVEQNVANDVSFNPVIEVAPNDTITLETVYNEVLPSNNQDCFENNSVVEVQKSNSECIQIAENSGYLDVPSHNQDCIENNSVVEIQKSNSEGIQFAQYFGNDEMSPDGVNNQNTESTSTNVNNIETCFIEEKSALRDNHGLNVVTPEGLYENQQNNYVEKALENLDNKTLVGLTMNVTSEIIDDNIKSVLNTTTEVTSKEELKLNINDNTILSDNIINLETVLESCADSKGSALVEEPVREIIERDEVHSLSIIDDKSEVKLQDTYLEPLNNTYEVSVADKNNDNPLESSSVNDTSEKSYKEDTTIQKDIFNMTSEIPKEETQLIINDNKITPENINNIEAALETSVKASTTEENPIREVSVQNVNDLDMIHHLPTTEIINNKNEVKTQESVVDAIKNDNGAFVEFLTVSKNVLNPDNETHVEMNKSTVVEVVANNNEVKSIHEQFVESSNIKEKLIIAEDEEKDGAESSITELNDIITTEILDSDATKKMDDNIDILPDRPSDIVDEEVIVSESNSPFVSVSKESLVSDENTSGSFEKVDNPVNNESIPPSSPKLVSKGSYNFNFDEIEDPFATKVKIRQSPPPCPTPNQSFEDNFKNIEKKAVLSKTIGNKNRRRSQPDKRKPNIHKKLNSTFGGAPTIDIENTSTENKDTTMNLIPREDNHDNPIVLDTTIPEVIENYNVQNDKLSDDHVVDTDQPIETNNTSKNNVSTDFKVHEIKNTSSSEHSDYYSAGASSAEGIESKSVFNIPEIDDINFNPFATKCKVRQSPPPSTDMEEFHSPVTGTNDSPLKITSNVTTESPQNLPVTKLNVSEKATEPSDAKDTSDNIDTTSSSKGTDDKDVTVRTINTEDEDTVEGPFLEAEDLDNDKMIDFETRGAEAMDFTDVPAESNDNLDAGEFFIDAEAYEFLLNQNANVVADSGKESLFLKFDPLFAKRMSSEGVMAALSKVRNKQSTPKKIVPMPADATFVTNSPVAGPSTCNITQDMDIIEDNNDDLNITVVKPMMVVTPAVNSVITPRVKTTTPVRSNRQSLTFTSPAIAVIDRLLSMSSNSSLMDHDVTVAEVRRDQSEADLALTQLRELLADKEISVYNLRTETKELKDRLETLEGQMKTLEKISEERLKKVNDLTAKLEEKTKDNRGMAQVVEEYERTISSLISETELDKKRHAEERVQLMRERDEQSTHLASMEISFNDLHSKYEKSKQLILSFKANEESYRKSIKSFEENFAKMQNNYEQLKQHATSKLNHANEELQKINRAHDAEVLKLKAMIKRKELHITSVEETLSQKMKANEELTKICDELLNKV